MSKARTRPVQRPQRTGRVRAVIYTRVSHDRKEGASVARQEERCRAYIDREALWDLVEPVYSDNDRSGSEWSRDDRPSWQRLLTELEAGMFDVLVVWDPSRATRDRQVWAALAYACEVNGVKICIDGRTLDPRVPREAFMLDLFFAIARLEVATTRERGMQDQTARASRGLPGAGPAPLGYRRIYSADTGALIGQEPDNEPRTATGLGGAVTQWTAAGLVRDMYASAIAGDTLYAIAKRLTDMGIPNPRTVHAMDHHPDRERKYGATWSPHVVGSMLTNRAYLGERRHNDATVKTDCWEALVDSETFYAVSNSIVPPGGGTSWAGASRPASARHLLTRIATCGKPGCGTPVEMMTRLGTLTGYGYRCRFGHVAMSEADVDRYVIERLLAWINSAPNVARIRAQSSPDEALAAARAEAERLRSERAGWDADVLARRVPREVYTAMMATLIPEIEEAERRAASVGIPPALEQLIGGHAERGWGRLSLPARRTAVRFLCRVRIDPSQRGFARSVPKERVAIDFVYED